MTEFYVEHNTMKCQTKHQRWKRFVLLLLHLIPFDLIGYPLENILHHQLELVIWSKIWIKRNQLYECDFDLNYNCNLISTKYNKNIDFHLLFLSFHFVFSLCKILFSIFCFDRTSTSDKSLHQTWACTRAVTSLIKWTIFISI